MGDTTALQAALATNTTEVQAVVAQLATLNATDASLLAQLSDFEGDPGPVAPAEHHVVEIVLRRLQEEICFFSQSLRYTRRSNSGDGQYCSHGPMLSISCALTRVRLPSAATHSQCGSLNGKSS